MFRESAEKRLMKEEMQWRESAPDGFTAYSVDSVMTWECTILAKKGSIWEGLSYKLSMTFSNWYPQFPPKCTFEKILYHPNIGLSGRLDMSLLQDGTWNSSTTIKDILFRIQELLDKPELEYALQFRASECCKFMYSIYEQRVKKQVQGIKSEDLKNLNNKFNC